ncbi:MAG: 2-oxoacid:acceptor oxidoreductase family protein [Planctomycetota bacterium]|jgi:pyruvate ferredoxin oxidoreductase gamma subunit
MSEHHLPCRDNLGMCNVFFSALGGDGANMAAKMLFKIGCLHFELDGGYDAKYGSEKKGTATDVSVRFCQPGTPVRQAGPVARPHFLVAYHEGLIRELNLNFGLADGAICIVNTRRDPDVMRDVIQLHSGKVICLDAGEIALRTGSRLNMPLLAALCHELGFDDKVVRDAIAKQWPRAAEANLAAYDGAVAGCRSQVFEPDPRYTLREPVLTRGQIGYLNMLNGGTIDALTHSTRGRDNRVGGKGRVPRFSPEACNSCGICLTVCCDPGGLVWKDGKMVGIDAPFCKGCMRCVEVCPQTKKGKALILPEEGDEEHDLAASAIGVQPVQGAQS